MTLASGQLAIDRAQHRLAVRVAALVVAHLPQLGRAQAVQPGHDLRGRELLVAADRERLPQPGGAARGSHQTAAPATDELREQLGRVVARDAAALDRVVENLLEPLARDDQRVEACRSEEHTFELQSL